MIFVKTTENIWWELDKERMMLFNYDRGYYYLTEEQLCSFETIECNSWRELYLKKRWCPLEVKINWPDVWISPDGKYYNGDAHENRAEEILEILYGEDDSLWPGDRLEELGWIRAARSLMWEVRLDSSYWNDKQLTQQQYDALWDWCKYHNKKFPQQITIK